MRIFIGTSSTAVSFYIHPASKAPEGKLRLMYEANPMAFIVEQAGGRASNGKTDILKLKPVDLHQRVPLYIGSRYDVNLLEKFLHGEMPG